MNDYHNDHKNDADELSIRDEEQKVDGHAANADDPGNSVLGMIADVEAQLTRIRSAQSERDEQLATLEQRANEMEKAERALEKRIKDMNEREQVLESLEADVHAAREGLEGQQREIANRSSDLQQREDALRQGQHELTKLREQIEEQRNALEHARAEFEATQTDIDSKREELQERLTAADTREQSIFDREQILVQQKSMFEELRDEYDKREAEILEKEQAIERGKTLLDQHWAEFNSERERISELSEQLEHKQATHQQEIELLRQELSAVREALSQAQEVNESNDARHAELMTRIEHAERNVGDLMKELEEKNAQLEEKEQALNESLEQQAMFDRARQEWQGELDAANNVVRQQAIEYDNQINTLRESLEEARQQLQTNETAQEDARNRLNEFEQRCEILQQELEQATTTLEAERAERAKDVERLQSLETELANFQQRITMVESEATERTAAIERERDAIAEELQIISATAEETEGTLTALREELDSTRATLQQRDEKLQDQANTLEATKDKLRSFAEAIGEQSAQVERGAEALATVREQKQHIERLKEQLTNAKMAADPEELARKNERIAELTEALHQARGQTPGNVELNDRDERIETLQNELDVVRNELQHAKVEAADALAELDTVRSQSIGLDVPATDFASSEIEALQQENHALQAQLREAEDKLASRSNDIQIDIQNSNDEEEKAELRDRISTLESQLEEARNQPIMNDVNLDPELDAQAIEAAKQEAVAEKNAEIESLRARLEEAKTRATEAPAMSDEQVEYQTMLEDLHGKADRVRMAADHLRRRRQRLKRTKNLLAQRSQYLDNSGASPAPASTGRPAPDYAAREENMQLEAKLQQQRQVVSEAARCLAESERAMIKKWAKPRAVTTAFWFVLLTMLLGVSSWYLADHFFPATYAANVTLEATPARAGEELSELQEQQWQEWHESRLSDEGFMRTAAKRFGDRKSADLTEPVLLRKFLARELTTDSTRDGELTLILTGQDDAEVLSTLDTLVMTLEGDSRRNAQNRTDRARTKIRNERTIDGNTHYAVLNAAPVSDERMKYAGMIFGGLFIGAVLFVGILYSRLAKARRVFDDSEIIEMASR